MDKCSRVASSLVSVKAFKVSSLTFILGRKDFLIIQQTVHYPPYDCSLEGAEGEAFCTLHCVMPLPVRWL